MCEEKCNCDICTKRLGKKQNNPGCQWCEHSEEDTRRNNRCKLHYKIKRNESGEWKEYKFCSIYNYSLQCKNFEHGLYSRINRFFMRITRQTNH